MIQFNAHSKLSRITDQFILRRTTASILRTSLPPKITHYLFTPLASKQRQLYEKLIELQRGSLAEYGGDAGQLTLTFLHALRLLCVHPSLIRESIQSTSALSSLLPILETDNIKNGDLTSQSVKMEAVELLLSSILAHTDEQILVISSYTQILDYFGSFCDSKNWGYFRLDGQTDVAQRQSLVNSFNHRYTSKRLFILSARAGGVGLNSTGASRVVMLEPAWNPAIDLQSIARAWRFGQTRKVFVYRLFVAGSIEEVMLQRQLLKKAIADVAVDHTAMGEGKLDREEMREVFRLKEVPCQTYLLMNGRAREAGKRKRVVVEEEEKEEDPVWRAYHGVESIVEDELLREVVAERSGAREGR